MLVDETAHLQSQYPNLVLMYDGFETHVSVLVLKTFQNNNIHMIAHPAHKSHHTQVLDYSVFSPFKTSFKDMLNRLALSDVGERKDIHTVCEILHAAYRKAMTAENIISAFKICGIWCSRRSSTVPEVIVARYITNWSGYSDQASTFISLKDLIERYKRTLDVFRSDGDVIRNGTVQTVSGALLTAITVRGSVDARWEAQAQEDEHRSERARDAERRMTEQAAVKVRRKQEKAKEKQRMRNHSLWLRGRPVYVRQL